MPEFALYDPAARRARIQPHRLHVRPATVADLEALTAIAHAREGGEAAQHRARFAAELERSAVAGDAQVLAAWVGDELAAFGRCGRLLPPADAPANCIPAGWYLTGVVVSPPHRRQGVASALTHARVVWLFERTDRVYYFVNNRNLASIALHAALGFREIARDIWAPVRQFTGGVGLLYALDRLAYAPPNRSTQDSDPHTEETP